MGLKEDLGIPGAASFVWGADGEIHIGDVFGGTWCQDRYDEDTGDYGPQINIDGSASDPDSESGIHKLCLEAAKEE